MLHVIGDVHGLTKRFKTVLETLPKDDDIIQCGDLGIGFAGVRPPTSGYKFIFGNHDCPQLCLAHPCCLGKFGVWKDVFFVSGAFSIDAHLRTAGVTWWPDEQLCREDMNEALDLYKQVKPRIVVSHDVPISLYHELIQRVHPGGRLWENATAHLLDEMFTSHQPEKWISGHWHLSYEARKGNTQFKVLNELEVFSTDSV